MDRRIKSGDDTERAAGEIRRWRWSEWLTRALYQDAETLIHRAHARSEKPSQKHEVAQGDVGTSIERRDDADESAFLQFGITPSRPCHVSSPRHVERSVRISSHCALLFVSPQGLWTYPAGAPFDSGRRPDSLQEAIGNLLWQIQRTARTMVATGVE